MDETRALTATGLQLGSSIILKHFINLSGRDGQQEKLVFQVSVIGGWGVPRQTTRDGETVLSSHLSIFVKLVQLYKNDVQSSFSSFPSEETTPPTSGLFSWEVMSCRQGQQELLCSASRSIWVCPRVAFNQSICSVWIWADDGSWSWFLWCW